jgi:hypothetical protein
MEDDYFEEKVDGIKEFKRLDELFNEEYKMYPGEQLKLFYIDAASKKYTEFEKVQKEYRDLHTKADDAEKYIAYRSRLD